ncbi:hypothetical protein ACJJTC_011376 [Scirpophaga incertulas]
MGSAASAATAELPGADLRLPTTGLKFSLNQLRALNSYVDTLYDEDQRGIGNRAWQGPAFRSPMIALHREKVGTYVHLISVIYESLECLIYSSVIVTQWPCIGG